MNCSTSAQATFFPLPVRRGRTLLKKRIQRTFDSMFLLPRAICMNSTKKDNQSRGSTRYCRTYASCSVQQPSQENGLLATVGVWSRVYRLIWAGGVPNLVGTPKRRPSASANWAAVITGKSGFAGACIFSRISGDNVSSTWKILTWHPFASTPIHHKSVSLHLLPNRYGLPSATFVASL